MKPSSDQTGVTFAVEDNVPQHGGNIAQRREHDKRVGAGTMSRTGSTCPCCGAIMTMSDIRYEGKSGRLGALMTAVVVDGVKGKEYRLPTDHEFNVAEVSEERLQAVYSEIPFGLPEEPTPKAGIGASRAFSVEGYGLDTWRKLFTDRQLITQYALIKAITGARSEIATSYGPEVTNAIVGFLACIMDRQADYGSAGCIWVNTNEHMGHQFSRFALPIIWDIAEVNPLTTTSGGLESAFDWVSRVVDHLCNATPSAPTPQIELKSAVGEQNTLYDAIITDPPYYDSIPYSDLMDFFHIWLRRLAYSGSEDLQTTFAPEVGPKWDSEAEDGELIDDAGRFDGDHSLSKRTYEDGMARAFKSCLGALKPEGRLVVVFASKSPSAWETLAGALVRAGFIVDGSWPIQTERQTRLRSVGSAALASSIWLVCRKRPAGRPGWDNTVLTEMRENITQKLRDYWDAGIRGPDFVWAATGPALEAFSKHPVVKKANAPDEDYDRFGVPARGAPNGGRFRRRPGINPGWRRKPLPAWTT